MKKELVSQLYGAFSAITQTRQGVEYWHARPLQEVLGYTEWRNFLLVIERAKVACQNSNQQVSDHFVDVNTMVDLGSGAQREIEDIALTRYACYLIAQNGDPKKQPVAFAQTYFAIQTRKQELIEQRLGEVERLAAHEKLTGSEKSLSEIIYERVKNEKSFGIIRSKGDAALFGGKTTQDMKKKLGVPDGRSLADFQCARSAPHYTRCAPRPNNAHFAFSVRTLCKMQSDVSFHPSPAAVPFPIFRPHCRFTINPDKTEPIRRIRAYAQIKDTHVRDTPFPTRSGPEQQSNKNHFPSQSGIEPEIKGKNRQNTVSPKVSRPRRGARERTHSRGFRLGQ